MSVATRCYRTAQCQRVLYKWALLAKQSCFPCTAHSSSSHWAAWAAELTAVLGLCSLSCMYPAWQISLSHGFKLNKLTNKTNKKSQPKPLCTSFTGRSLRQERCQQRGVCFWSSPQSHLKNHRQAAPLLAGDAFSICLFRATWIFLVYYSWSFSYPDFTLMQLDWLAGLSLAPWNRENLILPLWVIMI